MGIPDLQAAAFETRLINIGPGHSHIPFQVSTLIETVEQWKELPGIRRDHLLGDPWGFKEFVFGCRFRSAMLKDNQNRGDLERHLLLHMVFPDTFESIVGDVKRRITSAHDFARFLATGTDDLDRKLSQIRGGLENELGRDFRFYDDDIRRRWDGSHKETPWDAFVTLARRYLDTGALERDEIRYKVEIGRKLADARRAVIEGSDDWAARVKQGIAGNLVSWFSQTKIRDWIDESPDDASSALRALWSEDASDVTERV